MLNNAGENAGKGAVVEAEKVAIPEAEKSAEQLIDHFFQRLTEFVQKLGKALAGIQ